MCVETTPVFAMNASQPNRPAPLILALAVGSMLAGWCLAGWATGAEPSNPPAVDEPLRRFEFQRVEMAVPIKLIFYAPDEPTASTAAQAALDEVHRLNGVFSDYDAHSELRRLCHISGPGRPVKVSEDLWNVLAASQRLARQSGGAFDITVGPVVKLWRRARRRHELPPSERLEAARKAVGYQMIRLDEQRRSVELLRDDMRLDLGGIAKGYAIDAALDVLRLRGITRALIDAGGDVRLGDAPPGADGWRVAVDVGEPIHLPGATAGLPSSAGPLHEGDATGGLRQRVVGLGEGTGAVLRLHNVAIATSGDAWQHVEIDGVRYSHIVDPRTGLGLTNRSSVTVIAPSGMLADALASAVSVLGPERGLALVRRYPNAAVRVVRATGDGFELTQSDNWPSFVR
jgi:thiamine biosynthesis lipoprotein